MASRGSITCGVAPSRKERVCHKENHRHGELPQQLYPTGSVEIIHNRLESGQKLAYPISMTAAHNRDLLLVRLKIRSFHLWQSHLLPSRSCRHVAPSQTSCSKPFHGVVWRKCPRNHYPWDLAVQEVHWGHHCGFGIIKWKHFPRYWPFVRGIYQSLVNCPNKGQWRGALMFSLICAIIHNWVNSRGGGDLRRHRAHYDISVMECHAPCHTEIYNVIVP